MDSYAFSAPDDRHHHHHPQQSTDQPQDQYANAMTAQSQQHPQSAPAAGRPPQSYVAARGFNNGEVERKVSHESKPRLSKEQHDILENHFKIQPKPSTQTKKGFADSLGVPLDKINNWFQNRRAKVKQENKKRQQAYNLYFTPAGAAAVGLDQPVDSAWIDPSFYQTVPRHSMMVPPTLPVVAEVGDPMAAGGPGMMRSLEDGAPVMMAAGPEPMFNEAVFQQFFGFPEAVTADHNVDLSNRLNAFSKQFNSQGEAFEPMMAPTIDFEGYHSSAPSSLMTRSSNDDSSIQLSSISGDSYMWDSFNSATTTNSRPSLADSRSELDQSNYTYMLQQSRSHSSLPVHKPSIQQTVPENAPNFDDIHPDTTMSKSIRSSISEHAFPTPPEQFFSRAQAAIHDAQMSSAGLDELADEQERPSTAIRQTSESNLAARRRHRPANLIPLRTSSYNATSASTPSPSSIGPTLPDHAIRRIKSSTGVMTGRIQKPSGPNPRSPHYMNFQDGTNTSAKLDKSISVSPMTAQHHHQTKADQPTDSQTVPLTPPSPNSHSMSTMDITSNFAHQADVVEEMMWSQMTELDQLASSSTMDLSQEATEHHTEAHSYGSPPSTPRMGHSSDSTEDSCEPRMFEAHHTTNWQQNDRASTFQPQESADHNGLMGPRIMTIDPTMAHNAPVLASAEDAVQPRLHHSMSHQQFGWHVMPDEQGHGFVTTAQMPKSASDLYIHEWAPQDSTDSEAFPPRGAAAMQPPRNYQFSHHTPATFSSP